MSKFVMDIKGFTVVGENVYFCTYRGNGIFKLNISTHKVEYVTMTDTVKPTDKCLYADVKLVGTKLWFVPWGMVNDVLMYDIANKEKEYISLPMTERDEQRDRFGAIYEYKEWLIFTPLRYPAIMKINKETYEMKFIPWKEPLLEKFPDFSQINQIVSIYYDFEVVGDTMYLLAENVVVKYNMETDEISFVKICDEARIYSGIVHYNDDFVLVDILFSEVVRWDENTGNIQRIEADLGFLGENLQDAGEPFGLCKVGNQIVVMQRCADYLLLINSDWEINKIPLDIGEYKRKDIKFLQYKLADDKLYMPLFSKNEILIVDTSDWSKSVIEFDLEQLNLSELHRRIEREASVINEGAMLYRLENLIRYLETQQPCQEVKMQGVLGKKIYKNIEWK